MDLIGEHHDATPGTDVTQPHQVLTRPDVTGRILRIAEDQRVRVMVDAALQIVEIHRVAAVDERHRTL